MSIFAGIYCRNPAIDVPVSAMAEIRANISRSAASEVVENHFGNFYVASVDTGAIGSPGVSTDGTSGITVIAGDPVLRDGDVRRNRDRFGDAGHIHQCLDTQSHAVLAEASGTFAGVYFNKAAGRFALFIDKIGVRQVFVSITNDFIVFATAQRIMEEISLVPKRLSLKGLIEEVELHWSLARRTPYSDIIRLAPAEIVNAFGPEVRIETYWQWPEHRAAGLTTEEHLQECYARFQSAIDTRLCGDQEVLAFLSGGLDSRTIVAGLRKQGKRVDTINYAPPKTQDRVFAETFAKNIGSTHIQMPYSSQVIVKDEVDLAVGKVICESIAKQQIALDRPKSVWAGFGGSFALGHIKMTTEIVEKIREGEFSDAIQAYRTNRNSELARKPLRESVFEDYRDWPNRALAEELAATQSHDPDRKFYFFLMNNEQRRCLHFHYEAMDLHGTEYLLPFFDSDFLVAVSSVPVEQCLYHGFYNQWLKYFDDAVTSSPWQAYAGHAPGKVQHGDGLGYQWDESYSQDWHRLRRKARLSHANEMLASECFPRDLLSKPTIRMARMACLLGSDRLGYTIDKGYEYYRYAARASEIVYD